jgi:predicted dinucleotide-binding enzyme
MERLQAAASGTRFVKAFNSVGAGLMIAQSLPGGRPTMFIAGNGPAARELVSALVASLGRDVEDLGTAVAARAIEPLCMLWCIPGLAMVRSHTRSSFSTRLRDPVSSVGCAWPIRYGTTGLNSCDVAK